MKKKMISLCLVFALVSAMMAGCAPKKSEGTEKEGQQEETQQKSGSADENQILFNGSTSLSPVITAIATTFNETYGTWNEYASSL